MVAAGEGRDCDAGLRGDAGIAGRAEDTLGLGGLREFPHEGVFAAAATDDEDVDLG